MNHNTKDHDKYAHGGPPASFHARSSSVRENYSPSPRQEICPQRASTASVHSAQQLSLHHAMSPHVSVAQPTHPDLARRLPPASSTGGRASSMNHRSYQIYPYHSVDHGPFSPPHTPAEEIVHFYAPSGGPQTVTFSQVNAVQSPAAGAVYYPHAHGMSSPLHVVPPAFPAAEIGLEGLHSTKNSSRSLTAPGISSTGPFILPLSVHDALQTADNHYWTNEATPTAQPSSAELVCGVCGRTPFKRPHELHRHMESVHGPRKWTCDLCRKPFSRQDTMKRHKRDVHKVN